MGVSSLSLVSNSVLKEIKSKQVSEEFSYFLDYLNAIAKLETTDNVKSSEEVNSKKTDLIQKTVQDSANFQKYILGRQIFAEALAKYENKNEEDFKTLKGFFEKSDNLFNSNSYQISVLDIKNLDEEVVSKITKLHNECLTSKARKYSKVSKYSNPVLEPIILTVKRADKLVGLLESYQEGDKRLLATLAVSKESRGQGIARNMVNELEKQIKKQNNGTEAIRVHFRDTGVGDFYAKLGFENKKIVGTYMNGDPKALMEKPLT